MSFKKLKESVFEKTISPDEQQAKVGEVKKIIGPIADKFPAMCSDAAVLRFLRARNYNTMKAAKMLKGTIKWRLEFKPEKIQWDDVAPEAFRGRLYRADYLDKQGRVVFVIKAGLQSTSSAIVQIKYLVYCLEKAILNLNSKQDQMVWLIDFQGWSTSCISVKVTRETAQVLQNHYPERLGLAVLYNPPKLFESFWTMVKPFLEHKTYKKVTFAYPDNHRSRMMMEELFDMDKLESCFGGNNTAGMNFEAYGQKMREDDKRITGFIDSGCSTPTFLSSCSTPTFFSSCSTPTFLSSCSTPTFFSSCSTPTFFNSEVNESLQSSNDYEDDSPGNKAVYSNLEEDGAKPKEH